MTQTVESPSRQGPSLEGTPLVEQFVGAVLNERRTDAIAELFAPTFRDHRPLRLPGASSPLGNSGTVRDVYSMVKFLNFPEVDFKFVLEDVLEDEHRSGYRLFGQGLIQLSARQGPGSLNLRNGHGQAQDQRGVRYVGVPNTAVSIESGNWPVGKIVGNQLLVTYTCVGMFRVRGSKLAERWGPEILE